MPKRIPVGFAKKNSAEELASKLKILENNPTELYLMVVRNEFTMEDFAKLYLKAKEDWFLEEQFELFAKLVLQDEGAASKEAFRILDEIEMLRKATILADFKEAEVLIDFELYAEDCSMFVDEIELAEQIHEYMESDDSV